MTILTGFRNGTCVLRLLYIPGLIGHIHCRKKLGLEKVIEQLTNEVQRELNAIVGKLHLNINVNIPGLSGIEAELRGIIAVYETMKVALERDMQPFIDAMNAVRDDLNAFKALSHECTRVVKE